MARYVNRYGHIPYVIIGGWAAVRAMGGRPYGRVRAQQKHPHLHGYKRDAEWAR
jgi:hypothetical protein